jgi:hypothetical protein
MQNSMAKRKQSNSDLRVTEGGSLISARSHVHGTATRKEGAAEISPPLRKPGLVKAGLKHSAPQRDVEGDIKSAGGKKRARVSNNASSDSSVSLTYSIVYIVCFH